jgi:hypothetical protein
MLAPSNTRAAGTQDTTAGRCACACPRTLLAQEIVHGGGTAVEVGCIKVIVHVPAKRSKLAALLMGGVRGAHFFQCRELLGQDATELYTAPVFLPCMNPASYTLNTHPMCSNCGRPPPVRPRGRSTGRTAAVATARGAQGTNPAAAGSSLGMSAPGWPSHREGPRL